MSDPSIPLTEPLELDADDWFLIGAALANYRETLHEKGAEHVRRSRAERADDDNDKA